MTRRAGPSYLLLFVPYGLSWLCLPWPSISFLVAWLGSFAILWLSFSGIIKPMPSGRTVLEQILRPIVLTQIIFVTYTALTSIFAFLDLHGYYYVSRLAFPVVDDQQVALFAAAQRYYVLAHGALVAGMLAGMDYHGAGAWRLRVHNVPLALTVAAIVGLLGAWLLRLTGNVPQIVHRLELFGLVASVLALVAALRSRQPAVITLNVALYVSNLATALLSGWKEEVFVALTLLGLFAYPLYRRTVTVLAPIVLLAAIAVLPSYSATFRALNWRGGVDPVTAAGAAFTQISASDASLSETTWEFFTGRSSEISMFVRYIRNTPAHHEFYGTTIAEQAVRALVPRILWRGKPSVEALAMQRVYAAGIIVRGQTVSAKPQFVADAYLSAGAAGILIACFLYGLVASLASRLAERWFGGYLLGSGLMYNALFMSLWRGNCFEFLVNDVVWGFILLWVVFTVARWARWLVPAPVLTAEAQQWRRPGDTDPHAVVARPT